MTRRPILAKTKPDQRNRAQHTERVSASTPLRQAASSLEGRLDGNVLSRTTAAARRPTPGARLAEVGPALYSLDRTLDVVIPFRERPRGVVRLTMPQGAASMFLAAKLGAFARVFPDLVLDAVVDDGLVDVVRDGFDAGVRLGAGMADGMTSVCIGQDLSGAVMATQGYRAGRGRPEVPRDLGGHHCVNRRYAPAGGSIAGASPAGANKSKCRARARWSWVRSRWCSGGARRRRRGSPAGGRGPRRGCGWSASWKTGARRCSPSSCTIPAIACLRPGSKP